MTIVAEPRYVVVGTDVHDQQTGRIAKFQNAGVAQLGADWLNTPDATPEDYEWTEPGDDVPDAERERRAARATVGTIAADPNLSIEEMPNINAGVISDRSNLTDSFAYDPSGLPLVIRATTRGERVRIWRTPDGQWWRRAGGVRLQKWSGEGASPGCGERAFIITLFEGANIEDLKFLRSYVDKARTRGMVRPLWRRLRADWADDKTFCVEFTSRAYYDPYTYSDPAPSIWFCDDSNCSSTWHTDREDHEHDEIANDDYEITIWRGRGADEWVLSVVVDSCGIDSRTAVSLANDIQWMQQTCDKLNAAEVES